MPAESGSAGGGSGPAGDGERREGPRIPIEMWVEETTASERYFRRAGNLSRGGLGLDHTIAKANKLIAAQIMVLQQLFNHFPFAECRIVAGWGENRIAKVTG